MKPMQPATGVWSEQAKREARLRALAQAALRKKTGVQVQSSLEDLYGSPSPSYNPQMKHLEIEQQLRVGRRHNLLVGGSRSGKTFIYVKHILRRALSADNSRHAILRFRGNAAKASIRLDTLPKVARLVYPDLKLVSHDQDGYMSTPNNSEIWIGGLDEKDRVEKILGQEFVTIMLNEASQIAYSSVLIARTRLAQKCRTRDNRRLQQQELIDLNPVGKAHYTHREFIQKINPETRQPIEDWETSHYYSFCQPQDNAANLDKAYLASLALAPPRFRRRFYEGQYVDDVDGALWSMEAIEHARCSVDDVPVDMDRVVISVDPSGTDGREDKRSDDVGIVVMGSRGSGMHSIGYLLEDATCNEPPLEWGKRVIALYRKWGADRIVAEANFGGAMVKAVIDAAAHMMGIALPSVEMVTASRGKVVRAEPVSVLMGHLHNDEWIGCRVKHAGEFLDLEDELLNFSTFGYMGERSPNRADAYVWAATSLILGEQVGKLWTPADLVLVQ